MKLNFVFGSSKDPLSCITKEYDKSVLCDDKLDAQVKSDNWVVTRKGNICYLKIVNFNTSDNGQYDCFISLTNANSPYNEDCSNSITIISESGLKKHFNTDNASFGHIVTGFAAVVIAFIVVIVLVVFVVSPAVQCRDKVRHRRLNQNPPPGECSKFYMFLHMYDRHLFLVV